MSTFYLVLGLINLVAGFHKGPDQNFFLTLSIVLTTASEIIRRIDKLKPLSQ